MSGFIFFLRTRYRATSIGVGAALGVVTLVVLLLDFLRGGHGFHQGDWLINLAAGPIRRGPLGSALIFASDASGVPLLGVVVLLQAFLLALLLICTLRVFQRLLTSPAYTILLFSPGFFLIFWAVDPQGGLRKELLTFAAFSLLALVPLAPERRPWLVGGALGLFLIGLAGHEGIIVLLPALLTLLFIVAPPDLGRWDVRLFAGLFALATLGLLGFGVVFNRVPDTLAVCAPLLERGFDPGFCDGAIRWLDRDIAAGVERAAVRANSSAVFLFPLAYLLVSLPLIYLMSLHTQPGRLLRLYLLLGLPMLPFYGFTIDWGRWLNFHVVSFAFVLAALVLTGKTRLVKAPDRRALTAILIFGALFAPSHVPGIIWGGLVSGILGLH